MITKLVKWDIYEYEITGMILSLVTTLSELVVYP